ncbi:MAG: sugar ABC transporter ATP-binding protein [Candidatus Leucobacter sulfamidivorax]|nr:sugar ABC transporter ATP-binding protein [Candidatus Leucobacter sulfamidivorax]
MDDGAPVRTGEELGGLVDETAQPLLEARGVRKRFGRAYALDGVDFAVRPGRVHALLGHNGAGKSTLIALLSGALKEDGGEILVGGERVDPWNPTSAIASGIAVIYQHLSVIDSLSVADNIFLGRELKRGLGIDRAEQHARARAVLERLDSDLDTRALVGALTVAQKQLVEIAKALVRDARVLILDEPTAALSHQEADALGTLVEALKREGIGIVYVTHLIGEVKRLADEATVLEDGRVQFHDLVENVGFDEFVALLARGKAQQEPLGERPLGERVLSVEQLAGDGFGPIDLDLRQGEIVALFGMLGSGRGQFLRSLSGASRSRGRAEVAGRPFALRTVRTVRAAGILYVGPERKKDGLFRGRGAFDNLLMPSFGKLASFVRVPQRERAQWERARAAVELADIPSTLVDHLSGGNQQKVVVGRVVGGAWEPRVILLDEPTQGVDIGARGDLYRAIERSCAENGVGMIVSSNDPEEVLTVADRVCVFAHGVVVAELRRGEFSAELLIELASREADRTENTGS